MANLTSLPNLLNILPPRTVNANKFSPDADNDIPMDDTWSNNLFADTAVVAPLFHNVVDGAVAAPLCNGVANGAIAVPSCDDLADSAVAAHLWEYIAKAAIAVPSCDDVVDAAVAAPSCKDSLFSSASLPCRPQFGLCLICFPLRLMPVIASFTCITPITSPSSIAWKRERCTYCIRLVLLSGGLF